MISDAETLKKWLPQASAATLRLNSGISLPSAPPDPQISGEVAPDGPPEPTENTPLKRAPNAVWRLTLPYPPSSNRYWRSQPYRDKATGKLMVAVFVTTEAKEYKKAVQTLFGMPGPMVGPIGMRVYVYRPQRSGDLGNRIKVLEDALEGIAYANDNQIEYEELFRRDDKANPRVEVEIWQLPSVRQEALPI